MYHHGSRFSRLAFETMENRLLLTAEIAAVGPEPDVVVPAAFAAEEALLAPEPDVVVPAAFAAEEALLAPGPDVVVPAEIAAEVARLDGTIDALDGKGPRVRPGAEATRTLSDDGFIIDVSLHFTDVAAAPDLEVAPGDPTGDTAAPT